MFTQLQSTNHYRADSSRALASWKHAYNFKLQIIWKALIVELLTVLNCHSPNWLPTKNGYIISNICSLNKCISFPEAILLAGENVADRLPVCYSSSASKHLLYVDKESSQATFMVVVVVWSIGKKGWRLACRRITEGYRILLLPFHNEFHISGSIQWYLEGPDV